MKKLKELIINFINGFCMALADSVPGVSGGTVAFILGFYDNFINALDDLFRGNWEAKKKAFIYLIKIGIGWGVGFLLAASALADLFNTKIYEMSSLFLGFIIFAIPLVVKEEKEVLKGKYKNIVWLLIGVIFVTAITLISTKTSFDINLETLNIGTAIYIFVVAAVAISAMILPGISGSTILLIFGIYIPIMNNIKAFIGLNFSVVPSLMMFGFGMIFGVMAFARVARKCLEKHRSQTVYAIIGLMLGSIYSIIVGPTSLKEPQAIMNFSTFDIVAFIIGGAVIIGLEALKKVLNKKN